MARHWLSALVFTALLAGGCAGLPGLNSAVPTTTTTASTAPVPPPPSLPPVTLHETARNIQFVDLQGSAHRLEEFKGKFIVLVFFAHWCGVCQKELPVVQAFGDQHKDKNVVVVPVEATGATSDIVKAFGDRYNLKMPLYHDTTQAAATTYSIEHFPFSYIITPDFVVQEGVLGAATANFFEQRMNFYTSKSQ